MLNQTGTPHSLVTSEIQPTCAAASMLPSPVPIYSQLEVICHKMVQHSLVQLLRAARTGRNALHHSLKTPLLLQMLHNSDLTLFLRSRL